jgi:hypothetical protein
MAASAVAASHVSPSHAYRHREVVLFDNNVDRWSFLLITLSKWSYLSQILPHKAKYAFCNTTEENAQHLFFGCAIVNIIWSASLN